MITPDQARQIAKRLFRDLYPDEGIWFDLAWEVMACGKSALPLASVVRDVSGLGATSSGRLSEAMVDRAMDLAATFLIESPIAPSKLLARLEENSRKSGIPDALIHHLHALATKQVDEFESKPTAHEEPKYRVWFGTRNDSFPTKHEMPADELHELIEAWQGKYDLLIRRRDVFLSREGKPVQIQLEERVYRLLVLLVMNKGDPLPTLPLYRCAWTNIDRENISLEFDAVDRFLKPAISELRRKLSQLGHAFDIPRKTVTRGYSCGGTFAFCLILTKEEADGFKLVPTD